MPSAANGKSEKQASSEATDNSPIRQMMTVVEHKIRNLEKRKSKLTSYRDLQKAGKELKADQKVAVAKYDEVLQTLDFARDLSKQMAGIAVSAEKEAKKQAKKDAWVRYAIETTKIREVLLILDCLNQMGIPEIREDFINGSNGAAKLSEDDLKILDDLYPEVTPKHELNEEGQSAFSANAMKAAEHLYSIVDGKPKEVVGTTYARIKEIVALVHDCGYLDRGPAPPPAEPVAPSAPLPAPPLAAPLPAPLPAPAYPLPVPPAPAVVPAPAYSLRAMPPAMPPITLQEVEQAYFSQQYPPQRPIAEVIGSQNFFFLQESEIESPAGTPQPAGPLEPSAIPTQTFTNQHFVQLAAHGPPEPGALPPPAPHFASQPPPPAPAPPSPRAAPPPASPPERAEGGEGRGQGDAGRYRRYGRGRGATNGYRGRGGHQRDYNNRNKDGYQPRQYDSYQPRHKDGYSRNSENTYYGNGDADGHEERPRPPRAPRGRPRPPRTRPAADPQ